MHRSDIRLVSWLCCYGKAQFEKAHRSDIFDGDEFEAISAGKERLSESLCFFQRTNCTPDIETLFQ